VLTSITTHSIRKAEPIFGTYKELYMQYVWNKHMAVLKEEAKTYQSFILEKRWILSILRMKGSWKVHDKGVWESERKYVIRAVILVQGFRSLLLFRASVWHACIEAGDDPITYSTVQYSTYRELENQEGRGKCGKGQKGEMERDRTVHGVKG
jgi:hypothetical protein